VAVKTLYSVLGLEPTASAQDIDEAFFRAKVRFPQAKLDADENARILFQALQQAHATLSNPDSRALYDRRLAGAGVQVSRDSPVAAESSSWTSTRNIIVAGVILLLGSSMWFYYAHQRTKAEKEIAERALKLVEDEKRRQAEAQERSEQRRDALTEEQQRRREEAERRQFQSEGARTGAQAGSELRRAEAQAQMEQRRAQQEQANAERQRQLQQRQQEQEAARRAAEEKRQLQAMCMQRYGRPDC
jgi:curved DNA-binding protein CbpA